MPFFGKDPFKELEDVFNADVFGVFPAFRRSLDPAADVYQTDKDVVVELQVPKIDPKNIDIEVENNILTVSGKEEEEREEKNKTYYRREIRKGAFRRVIQLPVSVKGGEARADYGKGILIITLPKTEESRSKKIQIKTSE